MCRRFVPEAFSQEGQMTTIRKSVQEYIRAAEKLLKLKNLSEEEEQAVRDVIFQLNIAFPDKGDDAAD